MSNKAIAIGSAEMEALNGLPMLQRWLYMVLRWYMDRATGRVGEVRGISLQSLAEELYVEPVRGRHAADTGSPSKKAVRSALDGLARAGLAMPCGNGEVLVFFLPLARRASVRQKDEGHMRGTGQGHDERHNNYNNNQSFIGDEGNDEGHTQNRDEGHTSRERVNPLSVEAPAAAQPPTVERKLSTGPVLPLASAQIAEWIRQQERNRGLRASVLASASHIAEWVAAGVTNEQLAEAYSLAVIDRDVSNNPSPINVPFLDIFVRRVLEGSMASRRGGVQPVGGRILSFEETLALAERLGVVREAGEPVERLRDRVARQQARLDAERQRQQREVMRG